MMRIPGRIHRLTETVTKTTSDLATFESGQTAFVGNQVVSPTSVVTRTVDQAASAAADAAAAAEMAVLTSTTNKQRMLDAVKYGHQMWRLQAHFRNLNIMSITAIGTVDCLNGPDLGPLIKNAPDVSALQGKQRDLRDAVAHGVSECFAEWQDYVTVPGLPWYPSFAAFPGPQAPPTPNVPMPLIVCPSAKVSKITTASNLKSEMTAVLTSELDVAEIHALLDSICQSIATYFLTWLPMATIMNVLGQGPVPSFAPPYVPVGPVVGGSIIATPGHLLGGGMPAMIVFPTVPT